MSIAVLCTVAFIDATNYLHVWSVSGTAVKEGASKDGRARLYVDFGPKIPIGPQVRWVDENDCIFTDKTYVKELNKL